MDFLREYIVIKGIKVLLKRESEVLLEFPKGYSRQRLSFKFPVPLDAHRVLIFPEHKSRDNARDLFLSLLVP